MYKKGRGTPSTTARINKLSLDLFPYNVNRLLHFFKIRGCSLSDLDLRVVKKFAQVRAVGLVDSVASACPFGMTFMNEEHLLSDTTYRTHVMCVDNGGDSIFVGDVTDEAVDDA